MIRDLLVNKTKDEKAQIKAKEIAKISSIPKHKRKDGYFDGNIEIEGIKEIDGGIEYFARAWDKTNKPIGFGKDGSVEWERFRVFNSPVLVLDPLGDIQKEITTLDGDVVQLKFKEDPQEALLLDLTHTINKIGKDGNKIKKGKRGNTTSTIYSTGQGGYIFGPANATWATAHDATSGTVQNETDDIYAGDRNTGSGHQLRRGYQVYNTSSIGSDTISSVTQSLYAFIVTDNDNDSEAYINIVNFSPDDDTSVVGADFNNFGTTKYASDVDITGISTSAYTDFSFNATGIAAINTSGRTSVGIREGHDIEDTPTTLSSGQAERVYFYGSEEVGTSLDPKLTIEHAAAATFTPKTIIF